MNIHLRRIITETLCIVRPQGHLQISHYLLFQFTSLFLDDVSSDLGNIFINIRTRPRNYNNVLSECRVKSAS